MSGSSHGTRKRNRVNGECDECVPISKRINRLQIRPEDEEPVDIDSVHNNNLQVGSSPCCSGGWQVSAQSLISSHHNSNLMNNQHPPDLYAARMNGQNVHHQPNQHIPSPHSPTHLHDNHLHPHPQSEDAPYDPELDATKNPHYFHINGLLYQAHLSRLHRTNQPPD